MWTPFFSHAIPTYGVLPYSMIDFSAQPSLSNQLAAGVCRQTCCECRMKNTRYVCKYTCMQSSFLSLRYALSWPVGTYVACSLQPLPDCHQGGDRLQYHDFSPLTLLSHLHILHTLTPSQQPLTLFSSTIAM